MSLDSKNEGTVGNIPFLQKHAKATDVFSDFWLSTVKLPMSEKPYQQLQYSQNVGISFHEKFNGKQGLINWPHITINTLTKIDYLKASETQEIEGIKYWVWNFQKVS